MNELPFGALRSLMQAETYDDTWRFEVCALIERAHDQDADVYQDEWVPYLSGFPDAWSTPLRRTFGPDDLSRWQSIAPFASFDHVDWSALLDDVVSALENHPRVEILTLKRSEPASEELIESVQKEIGFELDPAFLSFFRACNGFHLAWITEDPEREETGVSSIFWNRSNATELPCGSLYVTGIEDLLDRPHPFEPFAEHGDYEVEAFGGFDDTELRLCMRDIDDFEVLQEADYSYYLPALVLHPRFPNPPVLMTDDAVASISSCRPMLAHDYLFLALSILGQEDVRMKFTQPSWGYHDPFVPPASWCTDALSANEVLDVLYETGDEAQVDRWRAFLDTKGIPTKKTPLARYTLPLVKDPFVVGESPEEGFERVPWDALEGATGTGEGLLVPSEGPERYLVAEALEGDAITDAALSALVGEPITLRVGGRWTPGALVSAGDELTYATRSTSLDGWSVSTVSREDVEVIGRARHHRLATQDTTTEGTWRPRVLLIPQG